MSASAEAADHGVKRAKLNDDVSILLVGGKAYPDTLVQHWRSHEHCDVILSDASGSEHPAHKIVLASECGYVHGLLKSGMRDSASTTINVQFPHGCVHAALEWIYCGRVHVKKEMLPGLIQTAAFLQLTALQTEVSKAWANCLDAQTCILALNLAAGMAPNAPDLDHAAILFALHNFDELAASQVHMQLALPQLRALLIDPRLRAREDVVFNALVAWHAAQQPTPPPEVARDLFGLVRYPLLSSSFIRDRVWGEAVMRPVQMQQLVTESFMALHRHEAWPPLATLATPLEEQMGLRVRGCAAVIPHRAPRAPGEPIVADRFTLPCFDISRGTERFPLTLNCAIEHGDGLFYGQLPPELRADADEAVRFVYDAGPIPATVKLQIFRRGRLTGLGYGLRVLQDVPKGQMVITYWGQYHAFTMKRWQRFRFDGYEPSMSTLEAVAGGHFRAGDEVRSGIERYWLTYHEEQGEGFSVNPFNSGNAARWINHSADDANLEMRPLCKTTAVRPVDLETGVYMEDEEMLAKPLLGLFASRDLHSGEELFWDYRGGADGLLPRESIGPRKSAPATGGVKYGPTWVSDELGQRCELLRLLCDDKPHVALWKAAQTTHKIGSTRFAMRVTHKEKLVLQGETSLPFSGDEEDSDHGVHCDFELPDAQSHPLPTHLEPWRPKEELWFDAEEFSELLDSAPKDWRWRRTSARWRSRRRRTVPTTLRWRAR